MTKVSLSSLVPLLFLIAGGVSGESPESGRKTYMARCVNCHGSDGNGAEFGPAIVRRLARLDDDQIGQTILNGKPATGMPPFKLEPPEIHGLVTYLRTLKDTRAQRPPVRRRVVLTDGSTLEGEVINESRVDLQLRTADGRIALLRPDGDLYRRVTSEVDWATYHGDVSSNRYSEIDQVDSRNADRLAPQWVFAQPGAGVLQVTPIVIDGIMYVTNANQCYALDAGTGRQLWSYSRPRNRGVIGAASGGINRGVAVAGDRVFMVTDHAHLFALDRFTGEMLWDTELADWRQNYAATGAPLVVGDLVIPGLAGGGQGARGFVAAYDQATGKEVWRTWAVPAPGEPGSETWGEGIHHPSAPTWMTGSYDPELGLIYWPTGNPGPDFSGDNRPGDNLYSESVLALDEKTGEMKWYFQFTPHDVWDWDATEPVVLVDADWKGEPRKLLLMANRNGYFYVLDRTNGEFLLGTPFVDKLTWSEGLDENGRPIVIPGSEPTEEGNLVCPSVQGGTNWFSTSYNPATKLFYVQSLERCSVFIKENLEWEAGANFRGGATRAVEDNDPKMILRAIDITTGNAEWELPQIGPANSSGGVISTAGGVVIFGDDSGAVTAADADNGEVLWSFQTNSLIKASPMTYMFDGKQYIAIAAGPSVWAFALRDR